LADALARDVSPPQISAGTEMARSAPNESQFADPPRTATPGAPTIGRETAPWEASDIPRLANDQVFSGEHRPREARKDDRPLQQHVSQQSVASPPSFCVRAQSTAAPK